MDLYPILAKVQEIYLGDRYRFIDPVPTIQAMGTKQLVRFGATGVLSGPDCRKTEVIWMEDCNDNVVDCSALPAGPTTPSADCAPTSADTLDEYKIAMDDNLCLEREFSVNDNDCNDAFSFEDKQALWISSTVQKLESALNGIACDFLHTNDRAPLTENIPASAEAVGANGLVWWGMNAADMVTGTDYWTNPDGEIITDLELMAEAEDMQQIFIVTGRLMRKRWMRALQSDPSCCDPIRQQLTHPGAPDIIFDMKQLDKAFASTLDVLSTYVVDAGSYAFYSANQFLNDTPEDWGSASAESVFRLKSPRLTFNDGGTQTPVYYDVFRTPGCARTAIGRYYHTWNYRISFNGGIHLGPRTCVAAGQPLEMNASGILHTANLGAVPA